jgi:glucose/arabinose dehydrogenase
MFHLSIRNFTYFANFNKIVISHLRK